MGYQTLRPDVLGRIRGVLVFILSNGDPKWSEKNTPMNPELHEFLKKDLRVRFPRILQIDYRINPI